jgi:hypothetical protein
MDHIGLAKISEETAKDATLSELSVLLKQSQSWIPKDASEKVKKFSQIYSELTVTGNGIILKSDRIVLPEALHQTAIELAHRGSHPAQSSMERRLRSHFFFHDMDKKVSKFLSSCLMCCSFNDKKTNEPLGRHEVPSKCWESVAVDLFGPMPSRNHVVVVQDLSSKFPAAKLVSSTSAERVLPALADIYNNFGNPQKQISDNGAPFNSRAMSEFAEKRDINLQKIPPLHPSSNPAETFMRPLGKTMKIAQASGMNESEALQSLLKNYRNTPHPATGVAPSAMLFRDGEQSLFPRQSASDEDIAAARARDLSQKKAHQDKVNAGKFRIPSLLNVGDRVLVRNYQKTRKFDPTFLPSKFVITEVSENGQCLTLEQMDDGTCLKRHPDDVKKFDGPFPQETLEDPQQPSEKQTLDEFMKRLSQVVQDYEDYSDTTYELEINRRPQRVRRANPRYYNEEYVNTLY